MNLRSRLVVFLAVLCALASRTAWPQQQPLNANVSDIGTSFVFSPPPVCAGCFETELGFLSLDDSRYMPAVLTLALPKGHTDANVLVNMLDSEVAHADRTTHFGNRFDFILRQQVATKGGFLLTLGPRGTVFVRGEDAARAGLSVAPQYAWGKNLVIANFTWTGGINVSPDNPHSDFVNAADYYRTLQKCGTAFFVGAQQEEAGGEYASIEQGLIIPFRNGQVELATEQLNLNTDPQVQVQARVVVNWGKLIGRK